MKKLVLITLIAAVVAAFFAFDLNQYLTLDSLKNSQEQLALWQNQSPFITVAVFFVIYVAATALSLPGATAKSL